MKKLLLLLCTLLLGTASFAEQVYTTNELNMDNFWKARSLNERRVQKITQVGYNLIYHNKLDRAPIRLGMNYTVINAFSEPIGKDVTINIALLAYMDNDDELAAVLAHELAHSMVAYDGLGKYMASKFNSKKYEFKSDLNGIDYMVKAGYNPIAAITIMNKISSEPMLDWASSHPKGSTRLLEMYKYIYTKYPKYLDSAMTNNVIYKSFLNSMDYEIKKFEQKQKKRQMKQEEI